MEWKFKEGLKPISSDDFWYDLTCACHIDPEKLLEKKFQAGKLLQAIELIESFERALEEAGLLEEFY